MFSQVTWDPLLYLPKPLPYPSFKYLIKWTSSRMRRISAYLNNTQNEGKKRHLKKTKKQRAMLSRCTSALTCQMTLTSLSFPFSNPWCLSLFLTLPAAHFRLQALRQGSTSHRKEETLFPGNHCTQKSFILLPVIFFFVQTESHGAYNENPAVLVSQSAPEG